MLARGRVFIWGRARDGLPLCDGTRWQWLNSKVLLSWSDHHVWRDGRASFYTCTWPVPMRFEMRYLTFFAMAHVSLYLYSLYHPHL